MFIKNKEGMIYLIDKKVNVIWTVIELLVCAGRPAGCDAQ